MFGAIVAFVATVTLMIALRSIAPAAGLIDRPGGRKRHEGEVAVIGGLAMFGGCMAGALLLPDTSRAHFPALLSISLLVAVGAADDRFDLSPWIRLATQLTAAVIMIRSGGGVIAHIATLDDGSLLSLGSWALPFTILAVVASINAYNLIDGLDGLAAGLGLIAISSFLLLAFLGSGQPQLSIPLIVTAAAIAAFLPFNIPVTLNKRLRCFMGDAGSTLIGLLVAWFGIRISQGADARAHPLTILWLTAIPVMELLVSFGRRLARGRSPFSADADHFHHLLLRAGFSAPATCAILLSIAMSFAGTGLLLEYCGADARSSLLLLLAMGTGTCVALRNIDACRICLSRIRRPQAPLPSEPF